MAFGCACGASGVHIDPRVLEADLLDHLRAQLLSHTGAPSPALSGATTLPGLLEAADLLPEPDLAWLLARVDQALRSWERVAGRGSRGGLQAQAVG